MAGTLRPLVIVNPAAAGGRARRERSGIVRALDLAFGGVDEVTTAEPGHATALAADAARRGCPLVVAVGGDGTVNEVADGLLATPGNAGSRPELAVVMLGTGADLARTLALPGTLEGQLARAADPRVRVVDAGRVQYTADDGSRCGRHFVNVASFGLSGATDRVVNAQRWPRLLGARLAFQLGVAQASIRWRNRRVAIAVDGGDEFLVTSKLCAVANGCWFGGGMRIAPDAVVDDGVFDVVVVGDVSAATLVRRLGMVYRGTHVRLPQVRVLRGRLVEARALDAGPVPIDLDGESPGRLPARFELLPTALRIRA